MQTGFREIAPGMRLHRIIINTSDTAKVLLERVPDSRINVIASSLSASAAGTVVFQSDTDTANGLGNVFKTADPAWVLDWNPDAWLECKMNEDLRLSNASGLSLRGIVIAVVIGDG